MGRCGCVWDTPSATAEACSPTGPESFNSASNSANDIRIYKILWDDVSTNRRGFEAHWEVETCSKCPRGTFRASNETSENCTSCSSGKYADSLGATSCEDCKAGFYSTSGTGTSQNSTEECAVNPGIRDVSLIIPKIVYSAKHCLPPGICLYFCVCVDMCVYICMIYIYV